MRDNTLAIPSRLLGSPICHQNFILHNWLLSMYLHCKNRRINVWLIRGEGGGWVSDPHPF